jgi:glutathione S-transferase
MPPKPWRNELRLYDCQTAPSPRRVRIFAAEKSISLEKVPVDLATGEQFGDAFRAINPDCVVPVLELDDGTCISEVIAICHYLEALHPAPALLGRTPVEQALTLMWNAKAEQQGLWATADAFRNAARGLKDHALPGPDRYVQIPELAERGRARASSFLEKMNRQLDGREFIAGDFYSLADITAMIFVEFAKRLKIALPDEAVHLQRWYDDVASRPSASA